MFFPVNLHPLVTCNRERRRVNLFHSPIHIILSLPRVLCIHITTHNHSWPCALSFYASDISVNAFQICIVSTLIHLCLVLQSPGIPSSKSGTRPSALSTSVHTFFFHHTCESTCDTLSSSAANQGDNSFGSSRHLSQCTHITILDSLWKNFWLKSILLLLLWYHSLLISFICILVTISSTIQTQPHITIWKLLRTCNPIYPTPPLGQDMTQGQFLSGV